MPRPAKLLGPLSLAPPPAVDCLTAMVASLLLREPLNDGDLDELEGRVVRIEIREPRLDLTLTVDGGRVRPATGEPAVVIRANAEDLLLVAAERVDPDTLFFQRRLVISGDTSLGLTVKNVLDAAAATCMPPALRPWLQHLADRIPKDDQGLARTAGR
ncbi:MAG TPA: SCP2 sterol-binding domain-containing protein [Gammaproteobacteria bacterium]|nr:SCP2 sterol-binding domain-containing protein [Gammaproteobacteria bacterium]